MKRLFLLPCCLVLALLPAGRLMAQVDLESLAQRAAVRHADVPRKVLAFYYPWYGNPAVADGSGLGMSWENLDERTKRIGNVAHFPTLGPYDSHDPKLIAQHCAWSKQAGVDGWIVSWWGRGGPTDRVMKPILDACQKAGLEVTIYYETVPEPRGPDAAAKDLLYVLDRYGDHPAWLRVGGKPVLFIYGRTLGEIGLPGWLAAITQVHRQYPRQAIFLGDQMSAAAARVFDGIHTYNPVGSLAGKSAAQTRAWAKSAYAGWVKTADAQGRISTITVVPGYDDTKIRKPGLSADRLEGNSYQCQWEEALAADPHWVLVTSWNEWYEGSEIEPSVEFGRKYLEMTAPWAKRFKQQPRKPRPQPAEPKQTSGQTPDAESAKRLANLHTALLPDADSPAIWSLVRLPVRPKLLSSEQAADLQAADAGRLPVLVYAGSEVYRQTVRRARDVDEGILRYLRAGGLLVVLPSGPMPFHYNEEGATEASSGKLGLPLSVAGPDGGWERPPEGVRLQFVQVGNRLPHVPARFPFPVDADPRWRPLVRSRLSPGDVVIPLVELRDEAGKHYGDAVAYVEHKASEPQGGKVLYAWFGLLDSPHGEGLIEDLLAFAAGAL